MSLSCTILETMSGNIQVDGKNYQVSFYIEAYTDRPFKVTEPRSVSGYCEWNGEITLAIEGNLTLLPSGPKYDIKLSSSPIGPLLISGKKQYQIKSLVKSLTHCPVMVYSPQDNQLLGSGEIAYRLPLWKFPLESVRFSL